MLMKEPLTLGGGHSMQYTDDVLYSVHLKPI